MATKAKRIRRSSRDEWEEFFRESSESPEPSESIESSESTESKNPNNDDSQRKIATLSTLNYYCLKEIFVQLPLTDLMNLRLVCSTLNTAILEYLPSLEVLPLLLSSPQDEIIAEKCHAYAFKDLRGPVDNFHIASYGYSTLEVIDNKSMLAYQEHFRPEDFTVIEDYHKYELFLQFITLHNINNIKKLAIIIHHKDYYFDIVEILKLWPRVQVLFLDHTFQCKYSLLREHYDEWEEPDDEDPLDMIVGDLFEVLISMDALKDLYFFSRNFASLKLKNPATLDAENYPPFLPRALYQPRVEEDERVPTPHLTEFLPAMFRRLRTFHINYTGRSDNYHPLPVGVYENLRDLRMPLESSFVGYPGKGVALPNLRTCTLMDFYALSNTGYNAEAFRNVTCLKLDLWFNLTPDSMATLNKLPNLSEFHCFNIRLGYYYRKQFLFKKRQPRPPLEDSITNKTIKHIVLQRYSGWPPQYLKDCTYDNEADDEDDEYRAGIAGNYRRITREKGRFWTEYFINLETCIVHQPRLRTFGKAEFNIDNELTNSNLKCDTI